MSRSLKDELVDFFVIDPVALFLLLKNLKKVLVALHLLNEFPHLVGVALQEEELSNQVLRVLIIPVLGLQLVELGAQAVYFLLLRLDI